MDFNELEGFYRNKKVLLTGHTGFKGSWLTRMLLNFGAYVTGYSLEVPMESNLYSVSGFEQFSRFTSIIGDVRDLKKLKSVFTKAQPDIVLHLAAQPIVRDSYLDPVTTYSTNVMGTVNLMECVRLSVPGHELNIGENWRGVKSVLNVTTDKVYKNNEWYWGYREDEPLNGYDPYSNSKSCSELVTYSFQNSFFNSHDIRVSTARAGNVIGGGDFANDRIVPDCVRAVKKTMENGSKKGYITVRNPYSVRPYQHVLEPIAVYLMIAKKQYEDRKYMGAFNVGPDECDCVTTGYLATQFCKNWNSIAEKKEMPYLDWKKIEERNAPHEAGFLKLDCSKIKAVFNWKPRWNIDECVRRTALFYSILLDYEISKDASAVQKEMDREIKEYLDYK